MNVLFLTLLILGFSQADEQLSRQKGCVACHDVRVNKVGPSYRDIAKKYKGRPDAVSYLTERSMKGGVGVWGNVPMPPQNISEEEAKRIVRWMLSLE